MVEKSHITALEDFEPQAPGTWMPGERGAPAPALIASRAPGPGCRITLIVALPGGRPRSPWARWHQGPYPTELPAPLVVPVDCRWVRAGCR